MVDDSKQKSNSGAGNSATATPEEMNLETYIARHGAIGWRDCLAEIHDVCFSLENQNVVYGDLTVRSILVTKNTAGGITLSLQSQASGVSEKAEKRSANSFPDEAYFSPEKCLSKSVDRRSDVYSLGCIMYHMLTGAPPFVQRDQEKLREAQAIDYALPPGRRSQRQHIPDEVDNLVCRCLEKDPAKRFKNASELRANLGNALQIEEDPDDALNNSAKFSEFFKKKRVVFLRVIAVVAVTALLGWLALEVTSSKDFAKSLERTSARHRNRWFLNLEHGDMYVAQAEFENGKMVPDAGKEPLELKMKDDDVILFSTTKRNSVKEAVEEAIRRRLILFKVNLIDADLSGAQIPRANMDECFAINSKFDGAIMTYDLLRQADFTNASMKNAKLDSANIERGIFRQANLEGADLNGAILIDCDFTNAKLKGANLKNTYLLDTTFTGADCSSAVFDGSTMTEQCANQAKLTPEQRKSVKIVVGPKPEHKVVRPLGVAEPKDLEVEVQTPLTQRKMHNPFAQPMEGSSFGPNVPANERIGLDIKIDKNGNPIPVDNPPPRKSPAQRQAPTLTPGTVPVPPSK
jgi:uncharacterized protein YjbI with pentapeptide repeats